MKALGQARGRASQKLLALGHASKRQTILWRLKRHVGASGVVSPMRIAGIDDWSWRNGFTGSIKPTPRPAGDDAVQGASVRLPH